MAICHQVSPALLLGVSAGNCQRALVYESGMIRTQMEMHSRSEIVAVYGMPCAIPTRNGIRVIHSDSTGFYDLQTHAKSMKCYLLPAKGRQIEIFPQ
jgi:hypothetical protein